MSTVRVDRPNQRLHGLDWLRAGATLLVVALHAGIAYLVAPMPGLAWPTHHPVGSLAVDYVTWWIDGFIMPLFFVLGGFVAFGLMQRKGPAAFLAHRTRRLVLPFALGIVLILPLSLYAWLLGFVAEGRMPVRRLRHLKLDQLIADELWGSSHLWFLQYLWLFCIVTAGVAWVRERSRRDHLVSASTSASDESLDFLQRPRPYSVLRTRYSDDVIVSLLGISALALWWEPQLVIGFRHSWWPLPANVLFYAPWFAIGWLTAARQPRRRIPRGEWRLVASCVAFAVLWPMIHQHLAEEMTGDVRLLLVAMFVLHAWLAVTGWFGLCVRWLDHEPPPAVKYVASASFWIYLFHHPVVGLAGVSLRTLAIPVAMKFVLTLTVGIVLPLLTYEALVRRTWIGLVLNGRRDVRRPAEVVTPMPLPTPDVQPERKAA